MIKNAQKINDTANLVEIIEDYLTLKKQGTNYTGLCPFHTEKTPSFIVSPGKDIFKCFGCHAGGKGGVNFVQKYEKCTYPEALKIVAAKYNIPVEETELTQEEKAKQNEKQSLQIITNFANDLFKQNISKKPAKEYLQKRKITKKTSELFSLGFAQDKWDFMFNNLKSHQYNIDFAVNTGLLVKKQETGKVYDKFRNRLMFPFFDLSGNIKGFTGRTLGDERAKYINSNNSVLYDKSSLLFGLFQAKQAIIKENFVYLVEGNTDVLSFHQSDVKNTIATSGTALTQNHINIVQRFTKNAVILFDGDLAGQKATEKSIKLLLTNEFNVNVITLPKKQDPDDLANSKTTDELKKWLEKNRTDFDVYLQNKYKTTSAASQVKFLATITDFLSYIPQKTARVIYSKNIAKQLDLDHEDIINNVQEKKLNTIDEKTDFFGLKDAEKEIKKKDKLIAVFNKKLLIKHHLNGKSNTIILPEIIKEKELKKLSKLSKNIVIDEVIELFKDNTELDITASLKFLTIKGFYIEIKSMDGEDLPDTYSSFVDYYISELISNVRIENDQSKKIALERSAELVSFLPESEAVFKTNLIIQLFNARDIKINASSFNKILSPYLKKNKKAYKSENTIKSVNNYGLTDIQMQDLHDYQCFFKETSIFFSNNKGGHTKLANFTIRPLFHINSVANTKKLFELTNHNQTVTVEMDMDAMVQLNLFKKTCETRGNFRFWGTSSHLESLKGKLYDETVFCNEIEFLGWQKQGFWSWADGIIYEKLFIPVDVHGIASIKDVNYYIPALSENYINDSTQYQHEKKFIRKISINPDTSKPYSLKEITDIIFRVYGDNSKLSFAAVMTAIFSDYIFSITGNMPIINLFGIKGTGKNIQIETFQHFFGDKQTVCNIHKDTEYAVALHVERFKNAIQFIDEYKNSLPIGKIEMLKSLYNRVGRQSGSGSFKGGSKIRITAVNSVIFLAGQEMPTVDVALFSRLIFLAYYKTEFSKDDIKELKKLEKIEESGFTHLTEEILQYRELIVSEFSETFYKVMQELSELLEDTKPDTRLIRNYATIITSFKILEHKLNINLTYQELLELSAIRIKEQQRIMESSNELGDFWGMIVTLVSMKEIFENKNFIVQEKVKEELLKFKDGKNKKFNLNFSTQAKAILYLNWEGLYNQYAMMTKRKGTEPMPEQSLKHYLLNSPTYLGTKKSKKFDGLVYQALCFDYKKIGINLGTEYDKSKASEQDFIDSIEDDETGLPEKPKDLPF